MKKIVNMTPHSVVVEFKEGYHCNYCGSPDYNPDCPECRGTGGGSVFHKKKVYEPSGVVARVEMEQSPVGKVDGFYIMESKVVGHNLPDPVDGTYLLVSAMVLSEAKKLGRRDCIAPNTNEAVRNEKGHIISVPGFVK
jgi:hypothetical protein